MWATFTAPFNFDRRPAQAIAFSVQPGLRNLPRDVVEAAILAGKAKPARAQRRRDAPKKQPAA